MSIYLHKLEQNLDAGGISVSSFSVVSNVPQATLSACLRGRLTMHGKQEAELYELSVRVLDIVRAIYPLKFERGDSESLKRLVQSSLTVDEIRDIVGQLFK
jgi:hypothetical protein